MMAYNKAWHGRTMVVTVTLYLSCSPRGVPPAGTEGFVPMMGALPQLTWGFHKDIGSFFMRLNLYNCEVQEGEYKDNVPRMVVVGGSVNYISSCLFLWYVSSCYSFI